MHSLEQRLLDYLCKKWSDCDAISIESFRDLPGGYSKHTYSFDAHLTRKGARQFYPLILRKDAPVATAIHQNRRDLEHTLLHRLREHTSVPVPQSYFVEMDPATFGEPAMIIERVLGRTDRSSLFKGPETSAEAEGVARGLCEAIAALHMTDPKLLNSDGCFDDPRQIGVVPESWDRYMDYMLDFLVRNYSNIDFDAMPVYFDALLHLRRNKPRRPLPLVLLHGELNPSNLIFQDGKLVALVDWECAHIGDPREDLAWFAAIDAATGTRFFDSIDYPGGFLGYYNHLTGFDISQDEFSYFQIFSRANLGVQGLATVKRGILEQRSKAVHLYSVQLVIQGVMSLSQLLGYPTRAQ